MRRVALAAAGWAVLTAGSTLMLAPAAHAATAHAVAMSNYAFSPASITVHVGDSVTWTNHDQAPHNIVTTSAPTAINSPTLSDGQSWSYTFTTPGTYDYICGVHPDMHASVLVLPAATVTSAKPPTSTAPTRQATPASGTATTPTASMPAMPPHHLPTSAHPSPTASASSTASPAAPAASAAPSAPAALAGGVPTARLKPLLLVAGLIAAVTVFCLLALVSRPGPPPE